jgi:hypothetical protein
MKIVPNLRKGSIKPMIDNKNTLSEQEIEELTIKSAQNMGAAESIFHPDYGWIVLDGKVTECGESFFDEYYGQNK